MRTSTSPIVYYSHRKRSVRSTMLHVMGALLPGTILYSFTIDYRIYINLFIAFLISLSCEAICLVLRKQNILNNLLDGSTILAAWLLVLCVPQSIPIWQLCLGVLVLVTLGKYVFGGLGQNPFNPAMVAYTFLLISFPVSMTSWGTNQESPVPLSPISQHLGIEHWDALSGATTLDRIRQIKRSNAGLSYEQQEKTADKLRLHLLNSPWTWVALAWLIGGIYLLAIKVISWHIPTSVLTTIFLLYSGSGAFGMSTLLSSPFALASGGILLGAFFIATDPVSAATSRLGQLAFGIGIGFFTFIIREFSAYPEGFAFAVLLMNMCVPLIDHIFIKKYNDPDKTPTYL